MGGVRNKWLRFLFLFAMGLIVIAFIVLDPILRSSVKRDQAGAIPRHGIARVEILVLPPANTEGMDVGPQVSVRFQGHLYTVKTVHEAQQLHEGGMASIEYRVGKSGRIYVDSAEPVPLGALSPPSH